MDHIIEPTINFDFSKLYLGQPISVNGGSYFTRLYLDNHPIYIQTPKSLTKQAIVNSGKKLHIDLMYTNDDNIFINWMENFVSKCQMLLLEKSEHWFQTKLDKDDIESTFTDPFKIYKSGKYYLLRANVKPNVKFYDDSSAITSYENITEQHNLLSILEIQGIKFSTKNFTIEFELKQAMIVSPDPFLDKCFIKQPLKNKIANDISTITTTNKTSVIDLNTDNINTTIIDTLNNPTDEHVDNTTDEHTTNNPVDDDQSVNSDTNYSDKPHIEIDNSDLSNILEFQELDMNSDTFLNQLNLEKTNNANLDDTIKLKNPNEVYHKIYKIARQKAKDAKKIAIATYLEAKNIKDTYMLDSDDDDLSDDDDDKNGGIYM